MNKFFLEVGEIVKPHGVRGELGVLTNTDFPELRFAAGSQLYMQDNQAGEPKLITVVQSRPYRKGYLVTLDCCNDRDEAENLRGRSLYVTSDMAPELDDGSYYHHQLIGLNAVHSDGKLIGKVVAVNSSASADLLEVKSDKKHNYLIPMVDEYVEEIDLEASRVVLNLPEGLLDL